MCGPVLTISRATCAFKTELLLPIIKRDNTNAADYIYKKFFLPLFFISIRDKSKEDGKDQESTQSCSPPDPCDKQKKTPHTGDPRGQPFPSQLPLGCKTQTSQYGKDK